MLSNILQVPDKQIGRNIETFLATTGRNHWDKMIEKIETTKGYYYKVYLYKRNPLAKAIMYYNWLSKTGRSIWKNINEDIHLLGSTSYLFNYLYKNLETNSKNILIGRIREDDIRSFLFEFRIVTHFFRNMAEIEFVDYLDKRQNKYSFDFFVKNKEKEFEVECKYKDYDSKRKITRPGLYLLTDRIMQEVDVSHFNCIVSFEFKESLTKDYNKQKKIIENLYNKITSNNWSRTEYDDYYLEIIPVEFNMPLDSANKMTDYIKPYYIDNSHFSFLCSKRNNFIIRFLTPGNEKLVDGIYESIKKAAIQFSKNKAAIIACHIEGIYPEEWNVLKDEGGLYNMTNHFLFKEENNFIHSVIYSSAPGSIMNKRIYELSVPYLTFKNLNTIFYNNYNTKELINL